MRSRLVVIPLVPEDECDASMQIGMSGMAIALPRRHLLTPFQRQLQQTRASIDVLAVGRRVGRQRARDGREHRLEMVESGRGDRGVALLQGFHVQFRQVRRGRELIR